MSNFPSVERRPGLEIVRAAAALMVMISHGFLLKAFPAIKLLPLLFQFSTEAVILFFVLSGVVMALHHERDVGEGFRPASAYLAKRIVRIYPIYLVALTAGALLVPYLIGETPVLRDFLGGLLFLQSLSGWIVSAPARNQALWSLSNEMTYYLLYFVVLVFPPFRRIWWLAALGGAVVQSLFKEAGVLGHIVGLLAWAPAWLLGNALVTRSASLPRFSVASGLCFLVIGLQLARSPLTSQFYDPFRLLAFAVASGPLFVALVQNDASANSNYRTARTIAFVTCSTLLRTIGYGLPATRIALTVAASVAAFIPVQTVQMLLSRMAPLAKPMVWLGSISYALYAVHLPIIFLLQRLAMPSLVRAGLFVGITLVSATILERGVQPAITRLAIPLTRRPVPPPSAFA